MLTKLKFTKRILIGFIIILVFFTFCSRSIMYMLTPKVNVEQVKSGFIAQQKQVDDVEVIYEKKDYLRIDEKLDEGLLVDKLLVYEGQRVKKGEALIIFDSNDCKKLDEKLKREIHELELEYIKSSAQQKQIEVAFEQKLHQLEEKKEDVPHIKLDEVAIKKNEYEKQKKQQQLEKVNQDLSCYRDLYEAGGIAKNEIDELLQQKEQLEEEIKILNLEIEKENKEAKENYNQEYKEFLRNNKERQNEIIAIENEKNEKILNLASIEDIKTKIEEKNKMYNDLKEILKTGQIVASKDGRVDTINVSAGDYYYGRDVLLTSIPVGTSVEWRIVIGEDEKDFWKKVNEISISVEKQQIPVKILGISEEDDKVYVYFKAVSSKDSKLEGKAKLVASVQSEFYNAVIPSNALVGDSVFVLRKKDKGLWGVYYYASKIEVQIGDANASQVGIISGIDETCKIITYWDREIQDQQRVMIEIP